MKKQTKQPNNVPYEVLNYKLFEQADTKLPTGGKIEFRLLDDGTLVKGFKQPDSKVNKFQIIGMESTDLIKDFGKIDITSGGKKKSTSIKKKSTTSKAKPKSKTTSKAKPKPKKKRGGNGISAIQDVSD